MVCLGNICRSPLAEGILKQKIAENNLNWEVDSCGTSGWHDGKLPDARSIDVAKKYGIDITNQRSRQLNRADYIDFDLIFAMDSSNFQNIMYNAINEAQQAKVKLIMNELHVGRNMNVPDPYWDDNGFENIYKMLNRACDKIIENYG